MPSKAPSGTPFGTRSKRSPLRRTDVDQRSVALHVRRGRRTVTVTVPEDPTLVPSGWYMLFVADRHGTPAKAVWIHVR
ncbi:galactose oxidase-like domain-containing protein [Streptomyces sp. BRA346]|uniref:galactose oxidase-like domain-containing protein n=1 Tax=Streptomyces sp. BRA346 TaxID=2878199 RepID=UPI004063FA63